MTFTIIRFNCLLAILLGLISTTEVRAQAVVATLEQLHGMIMIDRGDGYAAANAGDAVYVGDRILVMEESAGSVINGSCALRLRNNSLYIVGQQDACQAENISKRQAGPLYAAAIGIVKPKTETEEIEKPPQSSQPETTAPDQTVRQTPAAETTSAATAKGISPKAIAIGAGIAAALAALGGGGGGGGGNTSTPDH